jgi:hypothetical protein
MTTWCSHERKSERMRNYVEENSVRARVVREPGMGDRGYSADRTISLMTVGEFVAGRTDQRGGDNATEWKAEPQTQARLNKAAGAADATRARCSRLSLGPGCVRDSEGVIS